MYSNSSQKKFWTFSGEEELEKRRYFANRKFISDHKKSQGSDQSLHLSLEEERLVVTHYEYVLREVLKHFKPRHELLPTDVKGTAFHFYKRFYLNTSVMDFHPKEMMFTCIFLSCKVCEYVVPIDVFVTNVDGYAQLLKCIILDQELELLYRLNFRLNVHTPHRSIEGLMIDLRARSSLQNPERLNEHINRFMLNMWNTDVCLLYSPPLIALAAVMHAVSRCRENIDNFVVNTLLDCPSQPTLNGIISVVRKIRANVMNMRERPTNEDLRVVEGKLAKCRNPCNNPNSDIFKRKMKERALVEAHHP